MAGLESNCIRCSNLQRVADKTVTIPLPESLLNDIVSKNHGRKSEQSNHFYKCMSALLNNGTGIAILHTESPHLFGKFSEVVGNRLTELISDDSCYADNFEVSFHDDKHVTFRVKPVEARFRSVFSFKTKLSVDKGLADPTHGQFRHLCQRYKKSTTSGSETGMSSTAWKSQTSKYELITSQDKPRLKESGPDKTDFDFHECVGIEAKSLYPIQEKVKELGTNKVDAIFTCIWNNLRLPGYLTAFSKLPTGGSIFYGIKQDKEEGESKKWCQIEQRSAAKVLTLTATSHTLWESKQNKSVYLVAAKSDFRQETYPEEDKGTFSYEEILILDEDEQNLLSDRICEAARDELLWYPEFPAEKLPPVQVTFHPTPRTPSCYVAEVAIDPFPGFVFMDKTGPEVYGLVNDQPKLFLADKPKDRIEKIQERRLLCQIH